MPEWINQYLVNMNIGQLVAIALMFWFFYSRLDKKISEVEAKLEKKIDKIGETLTDVDRRVCRIEGAMSNQEGCAIRASNDQRKAE